MLSGKITRQLKASLYRRLEDCNPNNHHSSNLNGHEHIVLVNRAHYSNTAARINWVSKWLGFGLSPSQNLMSMLLYVGRLIFHSFFVTRSTIYVIVRDVSLRPPYLHVLDNTTTCTSVTRILSLKPRCATIWYFDCRNDSPIGFYDTIIIFDIPSWSDLRKIDSRATQPPLRFCQWQKVVAECRDSWTNCESFHHLRLSGTDLSIFCQWACGVA